MNHSDPGEKGKTQDFFFLPFIEQTVSIARTNPSHPLLMYKTHYHSKLYQQCNMHYIQ